MKRGRGIARVADDGHATKSLAGDVRDEEWAFVAPYLTLLREDAEQRKHAVREVFNAARWQVRAGAGLPEITNACPPCSTAMHLLAFACLLLH